MYFTIAVPRKYHFKNGCVYKQQCIFTKCNEDEMYIVGL